MSSQNLDEQEAEAIAEEVVRNYAKPSLPVCPITIAKSRGIEVMPKPSTDPGVSGFLMRSGNNFGILYANHIRNEGFIRFTVAHELGHYFLPGHVDALVPSDGSVHASRSGFIDANPFERQADFFASSLIMPEFLFKPATREAGDGFEAIQRLSVQCKTSITATAIRFVKFTDERVAVVLSSGSRIEWCFMSESLRRMRGLTWIRKGDPLNPTTTTGKFNRTPTNVSSCLSRGGFASLDDWFDGAPQLSMKEDVVGLGSYGKTLTVLFPDNTADNDDDVDDEPNEDD